MERMLSWVRGQPDNRDRIYQAAPAGDLPEAIDLRDLCSKVEDQGRLGSCTGNAIVGALELLENRERGRFQDLSRLFVYYCEREYEHTTGQDAGALIRDGMKVIKRKGVCLEALWPYHTTAAIRRPSDAAYADAATRTFSEYRSIRSFHAMKACLASRTPFVFGFVCFPSLQSAAVARTGIIPMPRRDEKPEGGHAVLCVGYNDHAQHMIVRNSWGPRWGDHGYCYMPYDYIRDPKLADEAWAVL
jgi:C1A family cysteine protease